MPLGHGKIMPDTILIVDDEPEYARILGERLRLKGHTVGTCNDPREAIQRIAAEPVAVVLLDLVMPELDGIEVLRRIKRIRPLTEVILLTGHATPATAVEGMLQGIFNYLNKDSPFERIAAEIDAARVRFKMHQDRIEQARHTAQQVEPAVEEDP